MAGAAGLFFDKRGAPAAGQAGRVAGGHRLDRLGLVLENVVRLGFGNDLRGYDRPIARDMRFGDIRVSPQQLETMALALAIMLAVFAALAFTRIGKAMRASADNPELAALKGIRPERIAMMASFVGMGLVGVGGMLLGLDSSIDPLTGTRILLSIFAAAVLGGLGSAPGAVLGAFLIGIAEELSVLVVGSPYRAAVGFFAILIVLACGRAGFWASGRSDARRLGDAELPPLHRHHRRHLRAAGAQPQPDLGRRGHGQSRPRRLLRRRRLCLGAADDGRPRADRRAAGCWRWSPAARRDWSSCSRPRGCARTISPSSPWASPRSCAWSPPTRSG